MLFRSPTELVGGDGGAIVIEAMKHAARLVIDAVFVPEREDRFEEIAAIAGAEFGERTLTSPLAWLA